MKVLVTGATVPTWRSIEVILDASERPEVILQGVGSDLARTRGIQDFSVGFNYACVVASAAVVATVSIDREESRP